MKAPLSWLKDFVDIDIPVTELAHLITMAGMEVEEVQIIGLPLPPAGKSTCKVSGLEWDREKIVAAEVREVMPHPNADRLVLCRLFDGVEERTVLTGAPNLYDYKGKGTLPKPLKVAYAKEGAVIYDGHAEGLVLTTLKRTKIRGVESDSMVCSEKELGISEEHEGIMFLSNDAVAGTPLVDILGDAVIEVNLLPSFARCASMLGLAREIAAITGKSLKQPALPAAPTVGKPRLRRAGDHRPRPEPAFRARADRRRDPQTQPGTRAAPVEAGGHAPDQQHRGRHQLRHARTGRTAARF